MSDVKLDMFQGKELMQCAGVNFIVVMLYLYGEEGLSFESMEVAIQGVNIVLGMIDSPPTLSL